MFAHQLHHGRAHRHAGAKPSWAALHSFASAASAAYILIVIVEILAACVAPVGASSI
jgi:hypothetical protein